jgi:hypothetical protein
MTDTNYIYATHKEAKQVSNNLSRLQIATNQIATTIAIIQDPKTPAEYAMKASELLTKLVRKFKNEVIFP